MHTRRHLLKILPAAALPLAGADETRTFNIVRKRATIDEYDPTNIKDRKSTRLNSSHRL